MYIGLLNSNVAKSIKWVVSTMIRSVKSVVNGVVRLIR